jgi:hypothetical protein
MWVHGVFERMILKWSYSSGVWVYAVDRSILRYSQWQAFVNTLTTVFVILLWQSITGALSPLDRRWASDAQIKKKKKCRSHIKIVDARRETWSKFHSEGQEILDATEQNVVVAATWRPGFVLRAVGILIAQRMVCVCQRDMPTSVTHVPRSGFELATTA